jgi:hypothetical protein
MPPLSTLALLEGHNDHSVSRRATSPSLRTVLDTDLVQGYQVVVAGRTYVIVAREGIALQRASALEAMISVLSRRDSVMADIASRAESHRHKWP